VSGVGGAARLGVGDRGVRGYGPLMGGLEPLVLVDVDGVLNPATSRAAGYARHWVFPCGIAHRLLLNSQHGPMLEELAEVTGAELVWASYWKARANTWIAPRIGLPSLRFVPIPTRWGNAWRLQARPAPGRWKARHVAAWTGQTPFVWLEDDASVASSLSEEPGLGRHLVVRVDPAIGLTEQHVAKARTWLTSLRP